MHLSAVLFYFYYILQVAVMLGKQLNTLVRLLVCLTATPNRMYGLRDANLRGLEDAGAAAVTRSKHFNNKVQL